MGELPPTPPLRPPPPSLPAQPPSLPSPPPSPPPPPPELITASLGEALIPMTRRIKEMISDFGISSGIDFPIIAFLGSEESGKSRLLEALVGRNFFHRTTCPSFGRPLRIELINVDEDDEWAEFTHPPRRRLTNFYEIGDELEAVALDEAKGKRKYKEEICLRIFSPNVLTLTLVDLPGLQETSYGELSKTDVAKLEWISSYIKRKTCLILFAFRASVGFKDSNAFQLAQLADPEGARTFAIITKADLMNSGTNALHLIREGAQLFKSGCFCVANTADLDVNSIFTMKDSLLSEGRFFENQLVYKDHSAFCGVPLLSKRLTHMFVEFLRQCMQSILSTVFEEEILYGCKVSEMKYQAGQLSKIRAILKDCCRDLDRICQSGDRSLEIDVSDEAFTNRKLAGCKSDQHVLETLKLVESEIEVRTGLWDLMHLALFRPRLLPLIFRANARMKEECHDRFAPRVIALGPNYHASPHLESKENLKEKFMLSLISRNNEPGALERYVRAVSSANFSLQYENIDVADMDFVKMMLIDGGFLLELIIRIQEGTINLNYSEIKKIIHDVLLLENQIPYSLLLMIFEASKTDFHQTVFDMLVTLISDMAGPRNPKELHDLLSGRDILHLLHFKYVYLQPGDDAKGERVILGSLSCFWWLLFCFWHVCFQPCRPILYIISMVRPIKTRTIVTRIPNASEMHERGITFRSTNTYILDVKFDEINGCLLLPFLTIDDSRVSEIINLLMLESGCATLDNYLCAYLFFLFCMIGNVEDLQLLRSSGVIDNTMGSDEDLVLFIKSLGKYILLDKNNHYLVPVFEAVNAYCLVKRHRWWVQFKKFYFSSPYPLLKLAVSICIIGLAIAQTYASLKK